MKELTIVIEIATKNVITTFEKRRKLCPDAPPNKVGLRAFLETSFGTIRCRLCSPKSAQASLSSKVLSTEVGAQTPFCPTHTRGFLLEIFVEDPASGLESPTKLQKLPS